MKIDGKHISSQLLKVLKIRVDELKKKGVIPHLYILLLSTDESSASYVRQKQIKGEFIGAKITLDKQPSNITTDQILKKIQKLNKDSSIHGIIVQRPMPKQLDNNLIANIVSPKKDIDGFNVNSYFSVPVAKAIFIILESIHPNDFKNWLKEKKIVIIGKGETAGQPIINAFNKLDINPIIITSKTQNKHDIIKSCDIVISAVGKEEIIKKDDLKNNAILIGVGLHRGIDGKFYGDYNEEEIRKVSSFYSPTPGGVGPVNVSCLLANLVDAAYKTY